MTRRSVSARPLIIAVLALMPGLSIAAQGITTAVLHGVVIDSDSALVSAAEVWVINTSTGERRHTITNNRGVYNIEYLSVGGPYTIEARAVGYTPATRAGLIVKLG